MGTGSTGMGVGMHEIPMGLPVPLPSDNEVE